VTYRGSAGDVVVKPAGTMHANTFDGVRIVSLDCDPALLEVRSPNTRGNAASFTEPLSVDRVAQLLG
jgi:hypothetical protein